MNGWREAASTPAMPPTIAARPQLRRPIRPFEMAIISAIVLSSAIARVCNPSRVKRRNAPIPTTTKRTAQRFASCCQLTFVPSTEKLPEGNSGTAAFTSNPQMRAATAARSKKRPNVRMIRFTGVALLAYRNTNSSDARPITPTMAIVRIADQPTGHPHS